MEQQIIEAVEDAVGRGVLAIVVLVILSGAAAFLASYLTVKGQNLAKKEDITDLEEAIQSGEFREPFWIMIACHSSPESKG